MKKFFFIFILVVLIGGLFVYYFKAPIVSFYLSKKLKVSVNIKSISFSKNGMKIKDFKIKNPSGYKKSLAFSSKEIDVKYDFSKLKKDPSIVDSISLKDNFLAIICKNPLCTTNNWSKIMGNIETKEEKKEKEVIIKKLDIDNLDVEIDGIGLLPGSVKKKNISYIGFSNVSSKKGFPTNELISEIFKQSGLTDFIKDFLKKQTNIKKFIDIFKKFEKSPEK